MLNSMHGVISLPVQVSGVRMNGCEVECACAESCYRGGRRREKSAASHACHELQTTQACARSHLRFEQVAQGAVCFGEILGGIARGEGLGAGGNAWWCGDGGRGKGKGTGQLQADAADNCGSAICPCSPTNNSGFHVSGLGALLS